MIRVVFSRGPYLSYFLPSAEENKESRRVAFENGHEITLPDQVWWTPISCRMVTTKPPWVISVEEGRATVPLLEEHGYIDRGIAGQDQRKNFPLLYYRTGTAQPVSLGLSSQQVEPRIRYVSFRDAYLLEGHIMTPDARPLWLLYPNGTVEQIFKPAGQAWNKLGWWQEFTKRGVVFGTANASGDDVRDSGLYFWEEGKLTRMVKAVLNWPAVSPNGCKLAGSLNCGLRNGIASLSLMSVKEVEMFPDLNNYLVETHMASYPLRL